MSPCITTELTELFEFYLYSGCPLLRHRGETNRKKGITMYLFVLIAALIENLGLISSLRRPWQFVTQKPQNMAKGPPVANLDYIGSLSN